MHLHTTGLTLDTHTHTCSHIHTHTYACSHTHKTHVHTHTPKGSRQIQIQTCRLTCTQIIVNKTKHIPQQHAKILTHKYKIRNKNIQFLPPVRPYQNSTNSPDAKNEDNDGEMMSQISISFPSPPLFHPPPPPSAALATMRILNERSGQPVSQSVTQGRGLRERGAQLQALIPGCYDKASGWCTRRAPSTHLPIHLSPPWARFHGQVLSHSTCRALCGYLSLFTFALLSLRVCVGMVIYP